MPRAALAASSFLLPAALLATQGPAQAVQKPLTLERIMADPDWIGAEIAGPDMTGGFGPHFSVDGKAVYYRLKRGGSPIRDLHRITLADGRDAVIGAADMATADGGSITYDHAGKRAAFIRNGDVFIRELGKGRLTQLTRSAHPFSAPRFLAEGQGLAFRSGNDWFIHDFASGVTAPAAILKAEKNPDAAPKDDDLRDLQLRLFSTLRTLDSEKKARHEEAETLQRDDATRAPLPFYLGDEVRIADAELSPDGRWMLVVTSPKAHDEGKKGKLTRYVTDSGYEEFEDEYPRVGRNAPAPQALWLLDLKAHTSTKVSFSGLPGIQDDPLKSVRDENAKAEGKPPASNPEAKPKDRELQVTDIEFSDDGVNAVVQLNALDNKDRWIATLSLAKPALAPQHRLHDEAWASWAFNEMGWEKDNRTLWYESEESGFGHLYAKPLDGSAKALTQGRFEVSRPTLSADGRWFYVRANEEAPWVYDVYRVPAHGGELQRITRLKGLDGFELSHDGKHLLIAHSSSYVPPQLAVVAADGSGSLRALTDTRTPAYKAMSWVDPEFIQVPSTHFKGSIWAKFYKPQNEVGSVKRAAVIFVHGAGYTQDVTASWSYYFREQMFHNLLLQHGYAVLDMDYRASQGYGRDWRTAIYRNMGHPELEDLLDGKQWLVTHAGVDPRRVGVYGGSYGGFMTLMALFRAPGEFAAGAALRPVTDWTQYNDGYTSAILNRPQVDALAYRRSSPIEFASGLQDPLLICHGVIDDNVHFEDSMRLYERLIELHKDHFWLSPYPLDRHGFTNTDSWLDEYKRIYELFQQTIGEKRPLNASATSESAH